MNKWSAARPSDSTSLVVVRSLRARFYAVRRYLRRAASNHAQPEDVHQLRVWLRRSEVALVVFSDLLPRRQAQWMLKRIRRIRRSAGRVRDVDVLFSNLHLEKGAWRKRLEKKRAHAVVKLVELRRRLGRKLKRRMKKLVQSVVSSSRGHRSVFESFARTTLRPMVDSVFEGVSGSVNDENALHQFRITSKQLRYSMELLAGAFTGGFRDELYPLLASLQDKLGGLNDLATMRDKLQRRVDRSGNPAELSDLRRRLAVVNEALERTRAEFARLWSEETRRDLRARFDEYVGDARAT